MRSPNKFQLKYILEIFVQCSYEPFTCVRSLESGKCRFVGNTFPLEWERQEWTSIVCQWNPPSPLSEDQVSYESFVWVRSPECGKGKFAKNTSPSSENAKAEQVWFTSKILLRLWVKTRSVISCFPWVRGLESGNGRFTENTSPSSENAKAEQRSS